MIDYSTFECTDEDYENAVNKIEDENMYVGLNELAESFTDAELAALWHNGVNHNYDYSLMEEDPKFSITYFYIKNELMDLIEVGESISDTTYFYYWENY